MTDMTDQPNSAVEVMQSPIVDVAAERKAFRVWWRTIVPDGDMPSSASRYFDVWMASARHRLSTLAQQSPAQPVGDGWRGIASAPKDVWVIGWRPDGEERGLAPAFIGMRYDMRDNTLIDRWSGRWAVCTHWRALTAPIADPESVAHVPSLWDVADPEVGEGKSLDGGKRDHGWPASPLAQGECNSRPVRPASIVAKEQADG